MSFEVVGIAPAFPFTFEVEIVVIGLVEKRF